LLISQDLWRGLGKAFSWGLHYYGKLNFVDLLFLGLFLGGFYV
jgi:hypothetical protein